MFVAVTDASTTAGIITSQTYNITGIFGDGTLVSTDTINAMTADPSGNVYVGSSAGKIGTFNVNAYRSYLGYGGTYKQPEEVLLGLDAGDRLDGVAYGNGLYVGIKHSASTTESVIRSTDGINWTKVLLMVMDYS